MGFMTRKLWMQGLMALTITATFISLVYARISDPAALARTAAIAAVSCALCIVGLSNIHREQARLRRGETSVFPERRRRLRLVVGLCLVISASGTLVAVIASHH